MVPEFVMEDEVTEMEQGSPIVMDFFENNLFENNSFVVLQQPIDNNNEEIILENYDVMDYVVEEEVVTDMVEEINSQGSIDQGNVQQQLSDNNSHENILELFDDMDYVFQVEVVTDVVEESPRVVLFGESSPSILLQQNLNEVEEVTDMVEESSRVVLFEESSPILDQENPNEVEEVTDMVKESPRVVLFGESSPSILGQENHAHSNNTYDNILEDMDEMNYAAEVEVVTEMEENRERSRVVLGKSSLSKFGQENYTHNNNIYDNISEDMDEMNYAAEVEVVTEMEEGSPITVVGDNLQESVPYDSKKMHYYPISVSDEESYIEVNDSPQENTSVIVQQPISVNKYEMDTSDEPLNLTVQKQKHIDPNYNERLERINYFKGKLEELRASYVNGVKKGWDEKNKDLLGRYTLGPREPGCHGVTQRYLSFDQKYTPCLGPVQMNVLKDFYTSHVTENDSDDES